jgi:hypothetical protein
MRISLLLTFAIFCVLAFPSRAFQNRTPAMRSVEPASGRIGDVIVVHGDNLGREYVAELYLTDGDNDVKVTILAQSADSIQFKIPPEAKAGRFSLMVLTAGKEPRLIEEPVKLTVEAVTGTNSGR